MDNYSTLDPMEAKIEAFLGEHQCKQKSGPDIVSFLTSLDGVSFDRNRSRLAKGLRIRRGTLDTLFQQSRPETSETGSGSSLTFPDIEPLDERVNGAELLNEIEGVFRRHIVLQVHGVTIATLWSVFSWTFNHFDTCPILFVTSPQKRCGKTTFLTLLSKLTSRTLSASNITPAALFRVIEAVQPTLVIDEADSFIKENEELRGIVNSGHTRATAFVIRTVGDDHEPRKFSTWAPKVFAGIGGLSDTLEDRSIRLELKRKTKSEKVHRITRTVDARYKEITRKIARWTQDNEENFKTVVPSLPEISNDRAFDNWTPLAVIASVAGGKWPEAVRQAILEIEGGSGESDSEPLSIELLKAIKEIFAWRSEKTITTHDLVEALRSLEDGPWETGINYGKGIDPRTLSRWLKPYGIRPGTIRTSSGTLKGYKFSDFLDTFSRYIPENPTFCRHNDTNENPSHSTEKIYPTQETSVTDENSSQMPIPSHCVVVSDKNPVSGEEKSFSEKTGSVFEDYEFIEVDW